MTTFSSTRSEPITIAASIESQVYGLFAFAMGMTVVGAYLAVQFASLLLTSGMSVLFLIAEFAIVLTSRFWMEKSPLNYVLFALFPLLSGITITPYLLSVLASYANGTAIVLNALAATTCMAAGAAIFAKTTQINLGTMGRFLFLAIISLLMMGILQIFFPSLRGGQMELLLSGAGVLIFALFTAYDIQRIQAMSRFGANPFLMALSLYLDIFNLFLYVLRFMLAMSGRRR